MHATLLLVIYFFVHIFSLLWASNNIEVQYYFVQQFHYLTL